MSYKTKLKNYFKIGALAAALSLAPYLPTFNALSNNSYAQAKPKIEQVSKSSKIYFRSPGEEKYEGGFYTEKDAYVLNSQKDDGLYIGRDNKVHFNEEQSIGKISRDGYEADFIVAQPAYDYATAKGCKLGVATIGYEDINSDGIKEQENLYHPHSMTGNPKADVDIDDSIDIKDQDVAVFCAYNDKHQEVLASYSVDQISKPKQTKSIPKQTNPVAKAPVKQGAGNKYHLRTNCGELTSYEDSSVYDVQQVTIDEPKQCQVYPVEDDNKFLDDYSIGPTQERGNVLTSLNPDSNVITLEFTKDGKYDLNAKTIQYPGDKDVLIFNVGSRTPVRPVQSENTSPVLDGIPNQNYLINSGLQDNVIDLWKCASDAEDSNDKLVFSLAAETNPGLVHCTVDQNRYIDCDVQPGLTGQSYVTIRVADSGRATAMDTFLVNVTEPLPFDSKQDNKKHFTLEELIPGTDPFSASIYVKPFWRPRVDATIEPVHKGQLSLDDILKKSGNQYIPVITIHQNNSLEFKVANTEDVTYKPELWRIVDIDNDGIIVEKAQLKEEFGPKRLKIAKNGKPAEGGSIDERKRIRFPHQRRLVGAYDRLDENLYLLTVTGYDKNGVKVDQDNTLLQVTADPEAAFAGGFGLGLLSGYGMGLITIPETSESNPVIDILNNGSKTGGVLE